MKSKLIKILKESINIIHSFLISIVLFYFSAGFMLCSILESKEQAMILKLFKNLEQFQINLIVLVACVYAIAFVASAIHHVVKGNKRSTPKILIEFISSILFLYVIHPLTFAKTDTVITIAGILCICILICKAIVRTYEQKPSKDKLMNIDKNKAINNEKIKESDNNIQEK